MYKNVHKAAQTWVDAHAAAGERLRQARKDARETQESLALKSGLTKRVITSIERGERRMTAHNALTLAAYVDASPAWLLFGA